MFTQKDKRVFGDLTIQPIQDSDGGPARYRVDYGLSLGSETFASEWDALTALDKWSDEEFSRLSKKLEGIAKLRRYIRRNLGGRHETESHD